jgi:hypothetical protein
VFLAPLALDLDSQQLVERIPRNLLISLTDEQPATLTELLDDAIAQPLDLFGARLEADTHRSS